jgi:hypothetical protein
MNEIIQKYLKDSSGEIYVPSNQDEKTKLARALLGYSIVKNLDYWLDIAKDYLQNDFSREAFLRDNELSRKDKMFRDTFSKLDTATKETILTLINSTATGIVFGLLTNFDQFDFGQLILSLKPKSSETTAIEISSDIEDLHDELAEWIYSFSKLKDELVVREEDEHGISYLIK